MNGAAPNSKVGVTVPSGPVVNLIDGRMGKSPKNSPMRWIAAVMLVKSTFQSVSRGVLHIPKFHAEVSTPHAAVVRNRQRVSFVVVQNVSQRIPLVRLQLHLERITTVIALCIELALELGDVGAADLPAALHVREEWLQHRRGQTAGSRLLGWSIVRNLRCSQVAVDRSTVHAHLSGDALNRVPGRASCTYLVPLRTSAGAPNCQFLLRLAGGWHRRGRGLVGPTSSGCDSATTTYSICRRRLRIARAHLGAHVPAAMLTITAPTSVP